MFSQTGLESKFSLLVQKKEALYTYPEKHIKGAPKMEHCDKKPKLE